MSKARVAVLQVISGQLTVTAAAKTYGLSRQHLQRLLRRYHQDGLDAVDPPLATPGQQPAGGQRRCHHRHRATTRKSRRPRARRRAAHPAVPPASSRLTGAIHLDDPAHPAPPRPDHRPTTQTPRSSYHRFEAAQPNQCWQSDFTHWQLADGTDVEVLNWLDDHSRFLLAATAYRRVAGPDVVASFIDTINTYGLSASTLTDNGSVYTARFTHGRNEFELLLHTLGVAQKNGHPGHPQTQGKIERFHQTLKRWLTPRPRPIDLADMQIQLDAFRGIYNTQRAHRALPPRTTPAQAYTALPKGTPPAITPTEHFRIRRDTVDDCGKLTLRYANRVHHPGIGVAHARTKVLILVTTTTVNVIAQTTHQLIASHHIDPDRNYWRNQQKNPGRWPGRSVTDDATQV